MGALTRSTLATSFVLGARLVVQAGTLFLVARVLGTQIYGAFAGIAGLAVVMGTLSSFGTNFLALADISRDPHEQPVAVARAVTVTLFGGLILLAAYVPAALALASLPHAALGIVLAIGVTELLLQPLIGVTSAVSQAHGRTAASQVLMTAPLALRLVTAGLVAVTAPSNPLTTYATGYLAASALTLGWIWIRMAETRPRRLIRPSRAELRRAAGFAVLGLTATGPTELDKTFALRTLQASDAGIFAAGTRIIGAATLPVIALMLSAMPRFFRGAALQASGNRRLSALILIAALAYSVPLAVGLWFAAPLLQSLFGHAYVGLEHVLHLLSFVIPGMAVRIASGSVLMSSDRPWPRAGIEVIGMLVLAAGAILLAPSFGLTGMAGAVMAAEWLMALIGTAAVSALHRIPRLERRN